MSIFKCESLDLVYRIRPMEGHEILLLEEFLYQALFVPEGAEPFERSILEKPELQVYTENFGSKKADFCLVAEVPERKADSCMVEELPEKKADSCMVSETSRIKADIGGQEKKNDGVGHERAVEEVADEEKKDCTTWKNSRIVGAAWVRIMNDYGHVDDETPSLAISLLPEYRKKRIGTALLMSILEQMEKRGYPRISLSVQKANYAVRMYEAAGFRPVREDDEEFIMVRDVRNPYK